MGRGEVAARARTGDRRQGLTVPEREECHDRAPRVRPLEGGEAAGWLEGGEAAGRLECGEVAGRLEGGEVAGRLEGAVAFPGGSLQGRLTRSRARLCPWWGIRRGTEGFFS